MNYKDFIVDGIVTDYSKLHWSSDWNGDEVGYYECCVVGLYTIPELELQIYIDISSGRILEGWYQWESEE